jgi:hypothetical protein
MIMSVLHVEQYGSGERSLAELAPRACLDYKAAIYCVVAEGGCNFEHRTNHGGVA